MFNPRDKSAVKLDPLFVGGWMMVWMMIFPRRRGLDFLGMTDSSQNPLCNEERKRRKRLHQRNNNGSAAVDDGQFEHLAVCLMETGEICPWGFGFSDAL